MSQYSVVIPTKPASIGGPAAFFPTVTGTAAAPCVSDETASTLGVAAPEAETKLNAAVAKEAANTAGSADLLITERAEACRGWPKTNVSPRSGS
jgi:hypothetical protein